MSEMSEPIPFSTEQLTSQTNRSNPQAGDAAPTLSERGTTAIAMALRGREDGAEIEAQEELAYALRTPGGGSSQQMVMFQESQYGVRGYPTAGTLREGRIPEHQLISSTEGSPARTSAWPAGGPVLGASAAVSGSSFTGCCESCGHDGRSLRMSPDFYPAAAEQTSPSSSPGWTNSGSMQRGRYWTRSTSESRSAAAACSLSQVLEAEVPSKFYLSARAAAGILRRAERRGKTLPEPLGSLLRAVAERPPDETASPST